MSDVVGRTLLGQGVADSFRDESNVVNADDLLLLGLLELRLDRLMIGRRGKIHHFVPVRLQIVKLFVGFFVPEGVLRNVQVALVDGRPGR